MKSRERFPITIDDGTTFRFAFRVGETNGTDRIYYGDEDLSAVEFRVRSGDYNHRTTYPMAYDGTTWTVSIGADVTRGYPRHRSMYYVIDATFASGDVKRLLEGPIRIRPLGGAVMR